MPALTEPSRLALRIRRLSLAGSPRAMGAIPQKHHLWQRTFRTFGPGAFAAKVGQAWTVARQWGKRRNCAVDHI